jgi:hypothetical protein
MEREADCALGFCSPHLFRIVPSTVHAAFFKASDYFGFVPSFSSSSVPRVSVADCRCSNPGSSFTSSRSIIKLEKSQSTSSSELSTQTVSSLVPHPLQSSVPVRKLTYCFLASDPPPSAVALVGSAPNFPDGCIDGQHDSLPSPFLSASSSYR